MNTNDTNPALDSALVNDTYRLTAGAFLVLAAKYSGKNYADIQDEAMRLMMDDPELVSETATSMENL